MIDYLIAVSIILIGVILMPSDNNYGNTIERRGYFASLMWARDVFVKAARVQ